MPEIRHLRIERFRGVAELEWVPKSGINAIVGPGDSAKSTILDAIEVVLSRRGGPFTEVDFTDLDITKPMVIDLTVGDLPSALSDIELYGAALRGWLDTSPSVIFDEPGPALEPVPTLRFRMDGQFEPSWSLYSERLEEAGLPRDMRNGDRALLAFLRLGVSVAPHLAWSSRSVLSQISGGKIDTAGVLARATRVAREEFDASASLVETREHLGTLTKAKDRPHVLDDATIDRVEQVHTEQMEFVTIYTQQISRWRAEKPSPARISELDHGHSEPAATGSHQGCARPGRRPAPGHDRLGSDHKRL